MEMDQQTDIGWPTCEEAGCIGVRLDSARMCLAHCSEKERAAALKLIGQTGVVDARGVLIDPTLLEHLLTAVPRGEDGEPLIKDCQFNHATFTGGAGFSRATFTGNAGFNGAAFRDSAGFNGVTFSGDAQFGGATFSDNAGFGDATFNAAAAFRGATFVGSAGFVSTTFNGDAAFRRATFRGVAWFVSATFSHDIGFGGATFTDNAGFGNATFNGEAEFRGTTFRGSAGFGDATFNGDTAFRGTTFIGGAWFGNAIFSSETRFDNATFNGDAGFDNATFREDAGFGNATFKGIARFQGARFEKARRFGPVLACRGLTLDDVQFTQPVQIEVSSTSVCCRRGRFSGGVQFQLRWARVVLDDTDLAAPSILTGIQHLSSEELARGEAQIAKAWQRLLKGEVSERPQLLSLRRANVAALGLSNVSVANCRFAGTHNLDKLRLESDVSFATSPLPLTVVC